MQTDTGKPWECRDPWLTRDHELAEFAVIVRSDLKGSGLGRILLRHLIEHARNRGVGRLVGRTLPENGPMIALARAEGFAIEFPRHGGDPDVMLTLGLGKA